MNSQLEAPLPTWTRIFRQLPPRHLGDGEAIIRPGERPTRLFYLERGRLRCSVASETGGAKTILYYWPGDICGETYLFDAGRSAPFLIASIGRSTVRSLGMIEVRRLMALSPRLAEDLMASMAAKTLAMADHIRQLHFLSVEARVADFLCRLSGHLEQGSLRVTHEEIADFVGAHRVSVTEALSNMERDGVLATGRGRITVRDDAALRRRVSG